MKSSVWTAARILVTYARMNLIISAFLLLAVFSLSNFSAEPAAGERELTAAESETALRGIAETFKAYPNIKAKLVSEIEDLAGKRSEEGEFVLERPVRVMRKFTKPSTKIWLLDGAFLFELWFQIKPRAE